MRTIFSILFFSCNFCLFVFTESVAQTHSRQTSAQLPVATKLPDRNSVEENEEELSTDEKVFAAKSKVVTFQSSGTTKSNFESVVYICNSEKANAFHSQSTCRALIKKCAHEVVKQSRKEAQESRVACKICY